MTLPAHVTELLQSLETNSRRIGYSLEHALEEKLHELEIRHFLRCLPNESIKDQQVAAFLEEVLGEPPTGVLLARLTMVERGPRLDEDEYLELEREQRGRCALCGVILIPSVRPHVDHRIPISLRGTNERTNLQLLCAECNLGKRALIGWIMGAPFLDEGVTSKLRYCVLTRDHGMCRWLDEARSVGFECAESSRSSAMEVLARIPPQRGGRMIFDNLRTLCADHARYQRGAWKADAELRLAARNRRGWSLS
jgi:5-methylcytosine-specific restriction endonuclease McrA